MFRVQKVLVKENTIFNVQKVLVKENIVFLIKRSSCW